MQDKIVFDNRAVYIPSIDTLVLSDIHLGFTDWEGADFPTGEYDAILERLDNLLLKHAPETVAIAGDVFHRFNRPPEDALATLQRITSLIDDYDSNLVVTPGNHDTYKFESDMFFDGTSTEIYDTGDGIVVLHGHELPDSFLPDAELYIIGHLHPTVTIQSKKRPAYLYGEDVFNDSDVLVLPSFSEVPPGTPFRAGDNPSVNAPLIKQGSSLDSYNVIVWDEDGGESLDFPTLKELDTHLG